MLIRKQGAARGSSTKNHVRYKGGLKPFPSSAKALQFAADARLEENGWAEVSRVITEIIERKR